MSVYGSEASVSGGNGFSVPKFHEVFYNGGYLNSGYDGNERADGFFC